MYHGSEDTQISGKISSFLEYTVHGRKTTTPIKVLKVIGFTLVGIGCATIAVVAVRRFATIDPLDMMRAAVRSRIAALANQTTSRVDMAYANARIRFRREPLAETPRAYYLRLARNFVVGSAGLLYLGRVTAMKCVRWITCALLRGIDNCASHFGCEPRTTNYGELLLSGFPTRFAGFLSAVTGWTLVAKHPMPQYVLHPHDGVYSLGCVRADVARLGGRTYFRCDFSASAWALPEFSPESALFEFEEHGAKVTGFCLRDGENVRFGILNNSTSFDVPLEVFVKCSASMYNASKNVYANDIITVGKVSPQCAATLAVLWNHAKTHLVANGAILLQCESTTLPHNYGILAPNSGPPPKPVGRPIGPPMAPAFVPYKSRGNDEACVRDRILAVRNANAAIPLRFEIYRREFVAHVVGTGHDLDPLSTEEVLRRQSRPSQLLPALQALPFNPDLVKFVPKSFQKQEAYPTVAPPRNITTVDPGFRVQYSRYTLEFADRVMKSQRWYAFGQPPLTLSENIYRFTVDREVKAWASTDYSKFDGTRHQFLNELEHMCFAAAFPRHSDDLLRLMSMQYSATARTAFGVKYDIGTSRLSGSPDTSIGNSLDNAFLAYAVFRDLGFSEATALESLGFYGGDDGITPIIYPDAHCSDETVFKYQEIVNDVFGMQLKIQLVLPPGNEELGFPAIPRLPFLGREFVNPWAGPESISDVPRQMRKAHISCAPMGIDLRVAAASKALGCLVTESQTPILGPYFRAMLRAIGSVDQVVDYDDSYMLQLWGDALVWHPPHNAIDVVVCQLGDGFTATHVEDMERVLNKFKGDFDDFLALKLPFTLSNPPYKLGGLLDVGGVVVDLPLPPAIEPPDAATPFSSEYTGGPQDSPQKPVPSNASAGARPNRRNTRRGKRGGRRVEPSGGKSVSYVPKQVQSKKTNESLSDRRQQRELIPTPKKPRKGCG